MAYVRLFDPLCLDGALISILNGAGLQPNPGDTIVLGAKDLTIQASTLPGDYNYVLVAETFTMNQAGPSGSLALTGTALNHSPSMTVLADQIQGALKLSCIGQKGKTGATGKPGGAKWVRKPAEG